MGENVTFTCVASGFEVIWIIRQNGQICHECGPAQGFWLSPISGGSNVDMTAVVEATASNNMTEIVCRATRDQLVEESAILIVQGKLLRLIALGGGKCQTL